MNQVTFTAENLPAPNLVIFRAPDHEDGTKQFIEVKVIDGVVQDEVCVFTLRSEEDTYNEMSFSHIVVGATTETEHGPGSIDLARYEITDAATGDLAIVGLADDLPTLISNMFQVYCDSIEK